LDTTTMLDTTEVADIAAVVNGPEDELLDWDAVGWRHAEENVRRLRQRIFAASRAGDLKRVRSLQKLMLRSRSNALVAVRRVTELNAGRTTAGVDGMVAVAPEHKAELADWLQYRTQSWSPARSSGCMCPRATGAAARSESP
jgi:RNA-directed DNA polymerase